MVNGINVMIIKRILVLLILPFIVLISCKKPYKEYYDNGNVKYEVDLKNGAPDGKAVKYYKDGTLMQESYWQNGVKEGTSSMYYANGKLRVKVDFKNGNETGIKEEYDSLGNLFKWYVVKNAIADGPHKVFNTEGRIILEGDFLNGVQDGLWKKYYDHGQLFGKYFIDKGRVMYLKEYDKSGKFVNTKLPVEVLRVSDIDSAFAIGMDFSLGHF
jgi:uncharacterized protein